MKLLIFIFGLGYLFITNSFAQGFYGAYHGSLVTDKNLLLIEEQEGHMLIKLFLSEKESIQVIGQISSEKLTFPLPQNEGEDLVVCAELSEDSSHLTIVFDLDGKSYSTLFERITSPKRDLVKTFFEEANTYSFDPDLIGDWTFIHLIDPNGQIFKDELTGKGYIETFLENGKWIFDPRAIQEQLRSAGIRDFSYEDLPQMKWKTKNRSLFIESAESTSESTYLIRNDSLFKTSKQGYTSILVRRQ